VESPAGEGFESQFRQPVTDIALENFVLKMGRTGRTRRIDSPQAAQAKELGGQLFEALFHDEMLMCLRESLQLTGNESQGLRIRLRLGATPELGGLPWEYLYDRAFNRFLCLSDWTPIVRYPEMLEPVRPVEIAGSLRILVMVSSPSDYPLLDVEQEWAKLKGAVDDLQDSGKIILERLPEATLEALRRQLRRNDYHALHFIGHGGFAEAQGEGVVVLTAEDGTGCWVSGESLAISLHDAKSLRLVVLNACEGARSDRSDPFSGVAMSLVQQGIPAVVAMQFEISDRAAIAFANEFYGAVADGLGIDASMGQARKAIHDISALEWATPVLYLRAADGRIFDLNVDGRLDPDPEPARASEAHGSPTTSVSGLHNDARSRPVDPAEEEAGSAGEGENGLGPNDAAQVLRSPSDLARGSAARKVVGVALVIVILGLFLMGAGRILFILRVRRLIGVVLLVFLLGGAITGAIIAVRYSQGLDWRGHRY
jgi:hypothetical protein